MTFTLYIVNGWKVFVRSYSVYNSKFVLELILFDLPTVEKLFQFKSLNDI